MLSHLIADILRNSILVTGLVTIMMMLIESVDLESKGRFFEGLRKTRAGQVTVAALLGLVPGCIGGFAAVSLYSRRLLSFGALVAMMIASCGDEAFMLLAMVPGKALWIFLFLLVIAITCGIIIDLLGNRFRLFRRSDGPDRKPDMRCGCRTHGHEGHDGRHFGWKRIAMIAGTMCFIAALLSGVLDHEHHTGEDACTGTLAGMNLLDETWMYVLFSVLCIILVIVLIKGQDSLIEEHLWNHVIRRHLPSIFLWTTGVLAIIGILLSYIDISGWISQNTPLMILLAAAIGIIPESGPHMIFVTLYAGGIVPLPVLLASCISQDGHSSLPLLAEDKKSFAVAKLLNCIIALIAGFGTMFLM